jgi:hypothetical protein
MGVLLFIGICIILNKFVVKTFMEEINSMDDATDEMKQVETDFNNNFKLADYGLVLLTVSLMAGLVFTSFLIPSHPIFMVVNIIGIFLLVFMGMIMTNVYGEFVAGEVGVETGLDVVAEDFPITNYLLSYLPYIGAIIIGIVTIVMYAKGQGGGYQ